MSSFGEGGIFFKNFYRGVDYVDIGVLYFGCKTRLSFVLFVFIDPTV